MDSGSLETLGRKWLAQLGLDRRKQRQAPFQFATPRPPSADSVSGPDITVLIPAYRHEEFIGEALRSVLAQTYGGFQVLVVDDASPDTTSERARSFQDSRIAVKVNQTNIGLGNSVLSVIDDINTPFVALLNSDDLFHPERLARCRDALLRSPSARLVATGVALIDANGGRLTRRNVSRILDGKDIYHRVHWFEEVEPRPDEKEPIFGRLLEHNFLATSSNIFCRTDFLRDQAEALKGLKYCFDWQLFLSAAGDEHGLIYLPEKLVAYRLHDTNTVWFNSENRWSYFVEVNRVAGHALRTCFSRAAQPEMEDKGLERMLDALQHLAANNRIDGLALCLCDIVPAVQLLRAAEKSPKIRFLIERLQNHGKKVSARSTC